MPRARRQLRPAPAGNLPAAAPPAAGPLEPLLPVRRFKQARAARTYEALLRAAAEVFARLGYEATQTPEIAARAGVSTGAFYRYFTDKRQAFIEMIAHHLDRTNAEVLAELRPERFVSGTGDDTRAAIDVAIEVLWNSLRTHASLNRVFHALSLSDPDVARLRARFEARGRAALAALIAQVIPSDVVSSPEAAAMVIQVAVLEVAAERVGLREVPAVPEAARIGDAAVKATLREMVHRFLFPGPAPAPRKRRR